MKKKFGILALIITFNVSAHISWKNLKTLEEFTQKMIFDKGKQQSFREYYGAFLRQQGKAQSTKKQRRLKRIRTEALHALEIKNSQWFNELSHHIENQSRVGKQARLFLTRYALYESFLQRNVRKKSTLLTRVGSYVRNVGDKVFQWTQRLRGKEITS